MSYKNCFVKVSRKSASFKWIYGISGNDYSVATLYKLYPTNTGFIMQSLKSIGQSNLLK